MRNVRSMCAPTLSESYVGVRVSSFQVAVAVAAIRETADEKSRRLLTHAIYALEPAIAGIYYAPVVFAVKTPTLEAPSSASRKGRSFGLSRVRPEHP